MKKIIAFALITVWLSACTTTTLKAPCNASGSNCGQRVKINQWDS